MEEHINVLNWNIGGAKYLESVKRKRDAWRKKLNRQTKRLLRDIKPYAVTLQEVVLYGKDEADGGVQLRELGYVYAEGDKDAKPVCAECVLDVDDLREDYQFIPEWLIDTKRHSAMGKWAKLYNNEELGWDEDHFFAQGNATLVRKDVPRCGIFHVPTLENPKGKRGRMIFRMPRHDRPQGECGENTQCTEVVQLECGLYFGDRNTEPRVAMVTHLVLDGQGEPEPGSRETPVRKPLDVFVVNLHLTTLMKEREGVPVVDELASQTRLRQLEIVIDGMVSRYNSWRKNDYEVRDSEPLAEVESRLPPVWILAGDFNFTPESVEYETVVRRGFIDMNPLVVVPEPTQLQLRDAPTKAKGPGCEPTITLDYVFVGPRFEAVPPTIGDGRVAQRDMTSKISKVHEKIDASDHYPVSVSVPISVELPCIQSSPDGP